MMTQVKLDLSVYLVTDESLASTRGRGLIDTVLDAVAGGVTTVQLREKDASDHQVLQTLRALSHELPPQVGLIVNDRVEVFSQARAAGVRVDGVHVGQGDMPVAQVRAAIGPDAVLGISAATPAELRAVNSSQQIIDYVGIGAVHGTATKRDIADPIGLDGFAERARQVEVPAVGIGGIKPIDMQPLRQAGAVGGAIVSAIMAAASPRAAAAEFAQAWGDAS